MEEVDMCLSEPRRSRRFLLISYLAIGERKAYMLDIPLEHLEVFKKTNPKDLYRYIPHDHSFGEPWRFRKLTKTSCLGSYTDDLFTIPAIVDTTVYCFVFPGVLKSLNLNNPVQWEMALQPTALGRSFTKLISLRGKLYIFGGFQTPCDSNLEDEALPSGEVFDPQTKKWSPLKTPQPPIRFDDDELLVASLGESEGKIMVCSPYYDPTTVYIYDTDTDIWKILRPSVLDSGMVFNYRIDGSEIINEDDNNLYWIEKRRFLIFAFDWKHNQLYWGPIIGLENPDKFDASNPANQDVSFLHLSADLFCVIWASYNYNQSDVTTDHHFTILRIIKHIPSSTLDALVVGCFHNIIDGSSPILRTLPA